MSNKILAFVEAKENKFRNSAFEVITEAKKLSEELKCEFEVLAIGNAAAEEDTKNLGTYGATKVNFVNNDELDSKAPAGGFIYSQTAFGKVVSAYAKNNNCNIIVLSATSLGKDIAPRIAVQTESAVCPDCVDIKVDGENIIAKRPVIAGKSYVTLKFNSPNVLITLRPNVFKAHKASDAQAEIAKVDIGSLGISDKDFKTTVKEIKVSSEKLDVAEADIIVSGGRGLRGPENFHLIEELAKTVGGATGASRAVVDAGWRPHGEQVGQTGKTVSPSLYIACGISGAIQHLAGMSSSKCIVAINKDKDAPIFQIADYGIVGDCFEILPALNEELKKVLAH
ncbi:MAG TPA: electron transfer flavoprotein subunit alpha/FixB family protein [Ignavibacteria bacterium]|nr:electron transfer flavoprotein subunit alpha/FixB family protein [Ignavibacteria bacterium]